MKYQISIKKIRTIWKNYKKSSKIIKSLNKNREKILPAAQGSVEILKVLIESLKQSIRKIGN